MPLQDQVQESFLPPPPAHPAPAPAHPVQGVSVYKMPDIRYNKKKPLIGYAWKSTQDQGPGFS